MKLSTVVHAVDLNPLYTDFIPYVHKAWTSLFPGIRSIILLIARETPEKFKDLEKEGVIIRITPIPNMHTAQIAQNIRLLFPALCPNDGAVIISDIDLIPTCKWYYENALKPCNENQMVVFRPIPGAEQYAMCFHAAYPHVWKKMFNVQTFEDMIQILASWNNTQYQFRGYGWCSDQVRIYFACQKLRKENPNKLKIYSDQELGFNRICRDGIGNTLNETQKQMLLHHKFTDYHCKRPFHQFEKLNNEILQLIIYGLAQKPDDHNA